MNAAPGWFPDSEVPGGQRYWDGDQWTEHRAAPPPKKPSNALPIALGIGGVLALVLVIGGIGAAVSGSPTAAPIAASTPSETAPRTTAAPKPTPKPKPKPAAPWYPKGYTQYEPGVAFKWVDDPDCGYAACVEMLVVTRDGCPSGLYGEVSLENSAGQVTGFANDLLPGINAGKVGRLTFEVYGEAPADGSLSEIRCY